MARRLLGPLLRSLDSAELFAKALTDEGCCLYKRRAGSRVVKDLYWSNRRIRVGAEDNDIALEKR
ncbi:hypothetical protein [Streptomyces sp. NPDC004134]|uniref:hypothetical protein n=1 Tax=Streptomyces sp. NPDC004134 TaxID=3364691 RepID=UPI0036C66C69